MDRSAATRYAALEPKRLDYLTRARKCSELTLPHLFPPDGATSSTNFPTPYQSLGARGVNNLSSKLLLSLLPPNSPFFKMAMSDKEIDELKEMGAEAADLKTELEAGLDRIGKRYMTWVEAAAIRPSVDEGMKQLIVGGNVLLFVDAVAGIKIYRLDRYVVRRDPSGFPVEIIIKEPVDRSTLAKDIRDKLKPLPEGADESKVACFLFTACVFNGDTQMYDVWQEVDGIRVGTPGSYPKDACRYIPLRLTKVACEDYGRSYVEQYFGDLKSLEGLTKSVVLSSQVVAKAVVLVKPGGVTNAKKIAQAETGDVLPGIADDVHMMQFDKWADLRVAFEAIKDITQRLAFAFLLNTAIQRNGERVTAEEVRYMARELDDALGGLYASLSTDFQLPFLKAGLAELKTKEAGIYKLPELPKEITPVLVTGVEALGRGHDLQKLDALVADLPNLGEEGIRRLNVGTYLKRKALALSVDTEGLFYSDEELAQQSQQAQIMALVEKLGPNAINQLGQMAQAQQSQDQSPNG